MTTPVKAKTGRKWRNAGQTAKEWHDKRQADVKNLFDALDQWKADRTDAQLADFLAKWDGYHGRNPLLIEMGSNGLATDVDARKAWFERERTVIGKDTGIKIVAPEIRQRVNAQTNQPEDVVTGWHIAYLFDIRHTIPSEPKDIHPIKDQWMLDHPESLTRPDGEPWPDGKAHRSWGDDEDAILQWHRQHDTDWTL